LNLTLFLRPLLLLLLLQGEVVLFGTLLLGFILLDCEKFIDDSFLEPAAYILILTALTAFYAMAHAGE